MHSLVIPFVFSFYNYIIIVSSIFDEASIPVTENTNNEFDSKAPEREDIPVVRVLQSELLSEETPSGNVDRLHADAFRSKHNYFFSYFRFGVNVASSARSQFPVYSNQSNDTVT